MFCGSKRVKLDPSCLIHPACSPQGFFNITCEGPVLERPACWYHDGGQRYGGRSHQGKDGFEEIVLEDVNGKKADAHEAFGSRSCAISEGVHLRSSVR